MATSYDNWRGRGNRSAPTIDVSTFTNYSTSVPENLIDGVNTASITYGWLPSSNQTWVDKYIRFDFGLSTEGKIVIDEVTWRQGSTATRGVVQWQGSDDAATWTNIGSSFTLGGATAQVQTELNGNTTGYRFYQLAGVSGSINYTSYINEIEFKIEDLSALPRLISVNDQTYQASGTSIPTTIPATAAVDDLLLAWVMSRSALTAPAGWTLVDTATAIYNGTTNHMLSVYKKVCTSGDIGAAVAWTQAASNRGSALIQVYRGTNIVVAGSAVATLDTTTSFSISVAPITMTAANQIIAHGYTTYLGNTGTIPYDGIPPSGTRSSVRKVADNRLAVAQLKQNNGYTLNGNWECNAAGIPTNNGQATVSVLISSDDVDPSPPDYTLLSIITQLPIIVVDLSDQPSRITQLPVLLVYSEGQPAFITQVPLLVVTGVKPVPPLSPIVPEVPLSETWSWKTIISAMRNGKEQRTRLREQPRYTLNFTALILDGADRRAFYTMLMRYVKQTFIYPLFQYNSFVLAEALAGSSRIACITSETDVRAGESIALYDPNTQSIFYELVQAVDSAGIDLVEPIAYDVGKNWQICPAILFRVPVGTGINMSNIAGDIELTLESILPREFKRPGASPVLTYKDGILIVPDIYLTNSKVKESFAMLVDWVDNGSSIPKAVTQMAAPLIVSSRTYQYDRRNKSDYWRALLDSLKGRQGVAMFPTFRDDLSRRDPVALNSFSFTTNDIEFFNYWREANYKYIRIESVNGVKYRKIAQVLATYNAEGYPYFLTVQLTESVGNIAGDNNIKMISFMNLCRLDTDDVTVVHESDYSEITFPIKAVNE